MPADPTPLPATLLLVRSAQRGEREAQEQLARLLWPWMVRVASRLLGMPASRPEVEDLVADTYQDVLKTMGQFQEREGCTFRDWIARLMRNTLVDERRRRVAQKRGAGQVRVFRDEFPSTLSTIGKATSEPGPEAFAQALEEHERLQRLIAQLPQRHRAVLDLMLSGVERDEMARELGITRTLTLNVAIHRARNALAQLLKESAAAG